MLAYGSEDTIPMFRADAWIDRQIDPLAARKLDP